MGAIRQTSWFLKKIANRRQTPRVPGSLRAYATSPLKQYPSEDEVAPQSHLDARQDALAEAETED